MFKTMKGYWVEILIGGILLVIDIKLFIFFFFLVYLISSEKRTDYLRSLLRINHITNEVKIISIMKKLVIDPAQAEKIYEEMEASMTEEAVKNLKKDFESVSNFANIK